MARWWWTLYLGRWMPVFGWFKFEVTQCNSCQCCLENHKRHVLYRWCVCTTGVKAWLKSKMTCNSATGKNQQGVIAGCHCHPWPCTSVSG
jgi:hypothetical protein